MATEAAPTFEPINTEHAVQSIAFTIVLDRPIAAEAVQHLRTNREILAELPAVQLPEIVEIEMQDTGPSASRRAKGIQLAHLRPDGTPAWALRMVGAELVAECTRYTRWERVWPSASRFLMAAVDALGKYDRDRKVKVIGQVITDVFVANQEPYDLSALLVANDLLAQRVFSAGATWHSHVGWFDRLEFSSRESLWLNQVNIDAVRDQDTSASLRKIHVKIKHNQELRSDRTNDLPTTAELDVLMNKLHINNKEILRRLLTPQMAARIGLGNADAAS